MKSKSVYLFVHFLHDVLEELQDMSNTFQKVDSSAMTIHRAMNQCLSTITKYKTRSMLPSHRWSEWNLMRRDQVLRLLQQKIQTLTQEKMTLTVR
ncbi:hypothetical protein AAFF_G00176130 [Aldrovandia affinis]|uniref:Uncharacterized protein n=1 Tax=Aldrovandia affinis TaxID=143900 RepID=A0AAD7W7Y9_9TELE|nr:hypothetical protein AAFF_G00176130 [Aldrovandia affinis]